MNFVSGLKNTFLFDKTINDPEQIVRKQIWNDNRKFAVIWASAQIFYWGFCLFMSFNELRFTYCRYVYLTAIIISALSLVSAIFFLGKVPRLIHLIKILVSVTILGGGLFIAWILLPYGYNTVTIFAAVLLVPVLFVNNTLSNITIIASYIIIAVFLLRFGLSSESYASCISDLVVFSTIGVTLGHFVNKARFERYVFAESAVQLAKSNAKLAELQTKYAYYDQMTELLNRRAYSEKNELLSAYLPDNCCAIIADINGLKKMNDTFGHDAGDELIIGAAECLRKSFEGIDTIYRIGGDEFCVILINEDVDVDQCLEKLEKLSAEWQGEYVDGISISCGYATSQEFSDIQEMLKVADQRMYISKGEYYMAMVSDET